MFIKIYEHEKATPTCILLSGIRIIRPKEEIGTIETQNYINPEKENSSASGYKTCGLCKGTGKDPRCNGTTRCQNHHVYSRIDNDCFKNCQCYEADDEEWFDEDETSEECRSRCKDKCKIQEPCDYCKSIDGTCSVMWCNNGVCRNCDGKGIAYYGNQKKPKK